MPAIDPGQIPVSGRGRDVPTISTVKIDDRQANTSLQQLGTMDLVATLNLPHQQPRRRKDDQRRSMRIRLGRVKNSLTLVDGVKSAARSLVQQVAVARKTVVQQSSVSTTLPVLLRRLVAVHEHYTSGFCSLAAGHAGRIRSETSNREISRRLSRSLPSASPLVARIPVMNRDERAVAISMGLHAAPGSSRPEKNRAWG